MRRVPLKVLTIIGTRPEAIKMAPVIQVLRVQPWCEVHVLATAQHREMLDQILETFAIVPDIDLDLMTANQALSPLAARLLSALDAALARDRPDIVLGQGDTTTVLCTAIACFHRRIPFGHVEAGLRTHDLNTPFPEEMNRVVADRLATFHFAPTERARRHLIDEGIPCESIHVTGNTVIDALLTVAARDGQERVDIASDRRLILVTAHRRENFGMPLAELCDALAAIATRRPDVQILYAVHLNPNVHDVVHARLQAHPGITLCPPLTYTAFVAALKRCYLVLTDSGGVQEEAPALAKPVLVLRDETERPEAVEAGVVKVIGMHAHRIVAETIRLLDDPGAYAGMAKGVSPYGDGRAAQRIADVLRRWPRPPSRLAIDPQKG
jgi:UDP-N-acetylglucosamine 2-epimerase (non-hydrolysing)